MTTKLDCPIIAVTYTPIVTFRIIQTSPRALTKFEDSDSSDLFPVNSTIVLELEQLGVFERFHRRHLDHLADNIAFTRFFCQKTNIVVRHSSIISSKRIDPVRSLVEYLYSMFAAHARHSTLIILFLAGRRKCTAMTGLK